MYMEEYKNDINIIAETSDESQISGCSEYDYDTGYCKWKNSPCNMCSDYLGFD